MPFFKFVVSKKKVQISFAEARKTIHWPTKHERIPLTQMDVNHILNTVHVISNYILINKWGNFSYEEWLDIFKKELTYRDLKSYVDCSKSEYKNAKKMLETFNKV